MVSPNSEQFSVNPPQFGKQSTPTLGQSPAPEDFALPPEKETKYRSIFQKLILENGAVLGLFFRGEGEVFWRG